MTLESSQTGSSQPSQVMHQASYQREPLAPNNMASFVARLVSLNQHELQLLHTDSELMRQLNETQLLMETRLQHIHQLQSKLHLFQAAPMHQQQQQQATYSATNQQQVYLEPFYQPLGGATHQLALDLRIQQEQQQQQQQQLAAAVAHNHNTLPQPQWQPVNCLLNFAAVAVAAANSEAPNAHLAPASGQHQALCSPLGSPQTSAAVNPKKLKLSEYQRSQRQEQESSSAAKRQQQQQQQQINDQRPDKRLRECNLNTTSSRDNSTTAPDQSKVGQTNNLASHLQLSSPAAPLVKQQQQQQQQQQKGKPRSGVPTATKKYKGEFDEPSPIEVELRQCQLTRVDNYHMKRSLKACGARGCACVLGSEFLHASPGEMLDMIDKWRHLPTQQRINYKWELSDLPKDIPLSALKKFEDIRREASNGCADFGGASKRKPLGIRGTRQFLLILYCLWGHPGRKDPMQIQGYCPHCFARIKKANEQSTLVRVVNHFNMKHRRGANPRLSPNRDTAVPVVIPATTSHLTKCANPSSSGLSKASNQLNKLSSPPQSPPPRALLNTRSSPTKLHPCNSSSPEVAAVSPAEASDSTLDAISSGSGAGGSSSSSSSSSNQSQLATFSAGRLDGSPQSADSGPSCKSNMIVDSSPAKPEPDAIT